MANTYQGQFPIKDTGEDGFAGIAPVAKFPPNGYGLYDMAGNVWQWMRRLVSARLLRATGRRWRHRAQSAGAGRTPTIPTNRPRRRATAGGSFLCTDQYCSRYMVGTRGKGEVTTGSNHLGFRCVEDAKTPALPGHS